VPQFQRHDKDSGSPEVQIARLTARVAQLTEHLAEHKKDYSSASCWRCCASASR
jgi:small subunit ribosomal protein S15